jgi:ATP-binding cassette subfamily F protein 3
MAALSYERSFELEKLQAQLCKSSLYSPTRKADLTKLLKRQGELKSRMQHLEELWREQEKALEEMEQG